MGSGDAGRLHRFMDKEMSAELVHGATMQALFQQSAGAAVAVTVAEHGDREGGRVDDGRGRYELDGDLDAVRTRVSIRSIASSIFTGFPRHMPIHSDAIIPKIAAHSQRCMGREENARCYVVATRLALLRVTALLQGMSFLIIPALPSLPSHRRKSSGDASLYTARVAIQSSEAFQGIYDMVPRGNDLTTAPYCRSSDRLKPDFVLFVVHLEPLCWTTDLALPVKCSRCSVNLLYTARVAIQSSEAFQGIYDMVPRGNDLTTAPYCRSSDRLKPDAVRRRCHHKRMLRNQRSACNTDSLGSTTAVVRCTYQSVYVNKIASYVLRCSDVSRTRRVMHRCHVLCDAIALANRISPMTGTSASSIISSPIESLWRQHLLDKIVLVALERAKDERSVGKEPYPILQSTKTLVDKT
nr:hypothetical protein CFP56_73358 [Quercus suber]